MAKGKSPQADRLREALREEVRAEVLAELRNEAPVEPTPGEDFFSGRAFRTGAIGAAAVLLATENREKLRPAVVGAMKEFLRFRDWLGTSVSGLREDLGDMKAEAEQDYGAELAEHLAAVEREKELVQRLQDLAKRRAAGGLQ